MAAIAPITGIATIVWMNSLRLARIVRRHSSASLSECRYTGRGGSDARQFVFFGAWGGDGRPIYRVTAGVMRVEGLRDGARS